MFQWIFAKSPTDNLLQSSCSQSHFIQTMSTTESESTQNDVLPIYQQKYDSMKGSIVLRSDDLNGKRPSSIKTKYEIKSNYSSATRGIRIVAHNKYSTDIAQRGKMYIPAKAIESRQLVPSLRQYHNDHRPTESIIGLSIDWSGKARLIPSVSDMYAVEQTMGRKGRTLSCKKTGNEMLLTKDGDSFSNIHDRQKDFFGGGRHISGSNAYSRDARADLKKGCDVQLGNTTPKTKVTYAEKKRMELLSCELEELRGLSSTSEHMGQINLSWEQRTGAYLVNPEDEDY